MTTTTLPAPLPAQQSDVRRAHRITCVAAGGLALVGGVLAILLDPWFAGLAVVGGLWLILAPEAESPPTPPVGR